MYIWVDIFPPLGFWDGPIKAQQTWGEMKNQRVLRIDVPILTLECTISGMKTTYASSVRILSSLLRRDSTLPSPRFIACISGHSEMESCREEWGRKNKVCFAWIGLAWQVTNGNQNSAACRKINSRDSALWRSPVFKQIWCSPLLPLQPDYGCCCVLGNVWSREIIPMWVSTLYELLTAGNSF